MANIKKLYSNPKVREWLFSGKAFVETQDINRESNYSVNTKNAPEFTVKDIKLYKAEKESSINKITIAGTCFLVLALLTCFSPLLSIAAPAIPVVAAISAGGILAYVSYISFAICENIADYKNKKIKKQETALYHQFNSCSSDSSARSSNDIKAGLGEEENSSADLTAAGAETGGELSNAPQPATAPGFRMFRENGTNTDPVLIVEEVIPVDLPDTGEGYRV